MDHRVHRVGLVLSIVCAGLALLTFGFLNQAFEGPSVISAVSGEPYHLEATFADAEALPTKQPVLIHGVEVGKVTDVSFEKATSKALVTFTVGDEFRPVHSNAHAVVGERTLLGDPYINLDPGTPGSAEAASGSEIDGLPSVDFDEALDFLDAKGRAHLRSLLDTLAAATRTGGSGGRLNSTIGALSGTVHNLRRLTDALHGQEADIAGVVRDGSVVLDEIGSREGSIRAIVSAGRSTLDSLATGSDSLQQGIGQLPGLLDASRRVLADTKPLAAAAAPVVRGLRRGAPDLAAAIADLAPLAGDALDGISGLAAIPPLRRVFEVVELLKPVAPKLEPAARNLVTALRYTAPRANGIASFFANLVSVTAHGDSTARWARFAILLEPGELADTPTPAICSPEDDLPVNVGFCHNAYPFPNAAFNPEPYQPGSYPRLRAFQPPPP